MIRDLTAVWTARYFWASLVKLDLRNRYRRSVLGVGWSLLNPIAMTVVFCVVFSSVLSNSDWRQYAPYLLSGMAVWEFIRNSLTAGCNAFIQNESYIRQCPLPYGVYPLRTVMGTGIHFLISLSVCVVMAGVLIRGINVLPTLWMIVPGMIAVALFVWGIATVGAFITVFFHDIKHLVEVGSQVFFFMTPLMYKRSLMDDRGFGWLVDLNPVNLYLELIRTPLLTGVPPSLELVAAGFVVAMTAMLLATGCSVWLQKKVIFHL